MSNENDYDDIFASGGAAEQVTPEVDTDDGGVGLVLDLSDGGDLGNEYPVMPKGTYVEVEVYDVEATTSKAGNRMYALVLAVQDQKKWGKNRKLRVFITLSKKAIRFSLPMLAALGASARVHSVDAEEKPTGTVLPTPVASVKEIRDLLPRLAPGETFKVETPSPHLLEGKFAVAQMDAPRQDETDPEKHWDTVRTLVSADDPKAKAYLSGVGVYTAPSAASGGPNYSG